MAKTFLVGANKFPVKEGQESTLATAIQTWLDGINIPDESTIYSIASEVRQGFVLVVVIASG